MVWKKGTHPWNYGKCTSEDVKKKISEKLKIVGTGRGKTKESEELRKRKISATMKVKGGGYRKESGRGKHGWYKGFWCCSSWELAWVIYNLDHHIKFDQCKETFEYLYNGKTHKYKPDFIQNGKYIEIKGYLTNQFLSKVFQFKKQLVILTYKELEPIIGHVIHKYGRDYIKFYDGGCPSG